MDQGFKDIRSKGVGGGELSLEKIVSEIIYKEEVATKPWSRARRNEMPVCGP